MENLVLFSAGSLLALSDYEETLRLFVEAVSSVQGEIVIRTTLASGILCIFPSLLTTTT